MDATFTEAALSKVRSITLKMILHIKQKLNSNTYQFSVFCQVTIPNSALVDEKPNGSEQGNSDRPSEEHSNMIL